VCFHFIFSLILSHLKFVRKTALDLSLSITVPLLTYALISRENFGSLLLESMEVAVNTYGWRFGDFLASTIQYIDIKNNNT
jgi:hypothetical protein